MSSRASRSVPPRVRTASQGASPLVGQARARSASPAQNTIPASQIEVDEGLDEHAEDDSAVVTHLLGDDEEILSPVRRSERITTSFDTCCSTLYAFLPAAIVPRSSAPASDVEDGTDLRRVRAVALPELSIGQRVAADGERVAACEPPGHRSCLSSRRSRWRAARWPRGRHSRRTAAGSDRRAARTPWAQARR